MEELYLHDSIYSVVDQPEHLALDPEQNTLYWADSGRRHIAALTLHTQPGYRVIIRWGSC